jgi:uncharacterized protein YraI
MTRLCLALSTAAVVALPVTAHAYWAQVSAEVNLRACPSTSCSRLAVLPRGATVWVNGAVGDWDHVTYGRVTGYAAASHIVPGAVPTPPAGPGIGPGGPTRIPGVFGY